MALLTSLSCARAPSPAEEQATAGTGEFHIHLSREVSPGDAWHERGTYRLDRVIAVRREGDVVARETEQRAASLEADVRVVAVTHDGNALERELDLARFEYRVDGIPGPPLPRGARVRVIGALDGDGVIEWEDGPLSEDAVRALRGLVGARIAALDDDTAFGSRRPRRIGDCWAVRAALVARELERVDGIRIAEGGLRGQTTLVEATEVAGVPCLLVDTAIEARLDSVPFAREGIDVDEAMLRAELRAWQPIRSAPADRPARADDRAHGARSLFGRRDRRALGRDARAFYGEPRETLTT